MPAQQEHPCPISLPTPSLSLSSSRDIETAQMIGLLLSVLATAWGTGGDLLISMVDFRKISGGPARVCALGVKGQTAASLKPTCHNFFNLIFAVTKSKIKRRKARERLSGASKAVLVEAIKQEHHAPGGAARLAPESVTGPETRPHTNTRPPHHADHAPQVQVRLNMNTSEEAQAASAENVDLSTKPGTGATSKRAPPTHTPTSLNSGPSSSEMAAPGQRKSPSVSTNQHDVPACPNVGLLKAQSPWLRKEGVCIAVLEDKSVNQSIKRLPSNYLQFSLVF